MNRPEVRWLVLALMVLGIGGTIGYSRFRAPEETGGEGLRPATRDQGVIARSEPPSLRQAGAPAPAVTIADRASVELLDQLLRARNDNDPRLDSEFNHLSPEAKAIF